MTVEEWLHDYDFGIIVKIKHRLRNEADDLLTLVLLKVTMGIELALSAERAGAKLTGLFYFEESSVPQLVIPSTVLLRHLHTSILTSYTLFKTFATGPAFEFLVCAQLQTKPNDVCCLGEKPTPVGDCLEGRHASKGKKDFVIPAAEECVIQTGYGAALEPLESCLVKLCESHFGIDYVIVHNPSLVPRLLPIFQCYTQKNGGAWYLIARDLCVQERPTV